MLVFFQLFNRNKKRVGLNLRYPRGLEAALRLAGTADVVVQNFKPGALMELGLGYQALSQTNPGLIYVNHTDFCLGRMRTAVRLMKWADDAWAWPIRRDAQGIRCGQVLA